METGAWVQALDDAEFYFVSQKKNTKYHSFLKRPGFKLRSPAPLSEDLTISRPDERV